MSAYNNKHLCYKLPISCLSKKDHSIWTEQWNHVLLTQKLYKTELIFFKFIKLLIGYSEIETFEV